MFTWICGFVCDYRCIGFLVIEKVCLAITMGIGASFRIHLWVLIVKKKKKKKNERKEEREIKYNEKDTFTPIFNSEKGEVGNKGLTEATSGRLSDNF